MRKIYGISNVIAADIRELKEARENGPFERLDVTDGMKLSVTAKRHNVDTIIHLAAILSAKAETMPLKAWHVNMVGLINALEVAKEMNLQFFTPSSIGAFGPSTPKEDTPQVTVQRPITMYGINKVTAELLCDYYFNRYGIDTRGIRFPGLISHATTPGGGTSDYAVDMYYHAVIKKAYISCIAEGTRMDMMYMPDALDAIIQLMEADSKKLVNRNSYNISAFSVAPEDFAKAIRKYIPEFKLDYQIDLVRQNIAESWPDSLDCTAAKEEWGFQAKYDLDKTTEDMLRKVEENMVNKNSEMKGKSS